MPLIVFSTAAIAVVLMWKSYVLPTYIVGQVEATQVEVISPKTGLLKFEQNWVCYQDISVGRKIAQVITTPSDMIEANLDALRAEIELMKLQKEPMMDQERNALDYEQLKLDWMRQRVELASAQVLLVRAQSEFSRTHKLFVEKLVSEDIHELAETNLKALQTEVDQKKEIVDELAERLKNLHVSNYSYLDNSAEKILMAAIDVQDKKLKLMEKELSPIYITAPISGQISIIHHRDGEHIMAGDQIITIQASGSKRILAYIEKPKELRPVKGMPVEVRSRQKTPQISLGKIIQIGLQLELIPSNLTNSGASDNLGLPIIVNLPPELDTYPGELVDLIIKNQQ
jgi:biotin carboxyl carrier protein